MNLVKLKLMLDPSDLKLFNTCQYNDSPFQVGMRNYMGAVHKTLRKEGTWWNSFNHGFGTGRFEEIDGELINRFTDVGLIYNGIK